MKFLLRSASFILFFVVLGTIIQLFSFFKAGTETQTAVAGGGEYVIRALEVPEKLEFAGEAVPVENFDIWESYDREILVNTYWQSQTLLFIKRANRYFPVIEPILKEYGIPDDFKYLAFAESGMMNVRSPAGAIGYWQFVKGTAQDYGLEVNDEVDERYHLEKSTVAASRYFIESYSRYKSWTMVAASYNAGRRGMDDQIRRQKETDYYDLLLNEETQRYIFRILAIKAILEDPEEYGFYFNKSDLYPPIESIEIEINSGVPDFADFAKEFNTNYKMIKYLNPWLRQAHLTNSRGKTYYISLPADGARVRGKYFNNDDEPAMGSAD